MAACNPSAHPWSPYPPRSLVAAQRRLYLPVTLSRRPGGRLGPPERAGGLRRGLVFNVPSDTPPLPPAVCNHETKKRTKTGIRRECRKNQKRKVKMPTGKGRRKSASGGDWGIRLCQARLRHAASVLGIIDGRGRGPEFDDHGSANALPWSSNSGPVSVLGVAGPCRVRAPRGADACGCRELIRAH